MVMAFGCSLGTPVQGAKTNPWPAHCHFRHVGSIEETSARSKPFTNKPSITSDPRVQKNKRSLPLNNRIFSGHLTVTQAEVTELVTQICCNLAEISRPKTRPLSHWLPRRERSADCPPTRLVCRNCCDMGHAMKLLCGERPDSGHQG